MKVYAWNSEKNETLILERGISFEEIVLNIQLGNEVDIFDHPNQERYPGQKISVVLVEKYKTNKRGVESNFLSEFQSPNLKRWRGGRVTD